MPKNQVSVEELRCRIMKLKNNAYFDVVPIAEGSSERRHLYPGENSSWFRGTSTMFWTFFKNIGIRG